MLIVPALYLLIAVVVMLLALVVVDPYGHFTPAKRWRDAVLIGAFWLPMLVYAASLMAWDYFRNRS